MKNKKMKNENLEKIVGEKQKKLLNDLQEHIRKYTELQITLGNPSAFDFMDYSPRVLKTEFNGMIDDLFVYGQKVPSFGAGPRGIAFGHYPHYTIGLTSDDVSNIEYAVFDFLSKNGFEVYAKSESPEKPISVLGKMDHEPLHIADWQGDFWYNNGLVSQFQLWIDDGMCLKKDLELQDNGNYKIKDQGDFRDIELVRYKTKLK